MNFRKQLNYHNMLQVVSILEDMKIGKTKDEFLFIFSCDNNARDVPVHPGDWSLCQDSRVGIQITEYRLQIHE